jgi:hypothetical protein
MRNIWKMLSPILEGIYVILTVPFLAAYAVVFPEDDETGSGLLP